MIIDVSQIISNDGAVKKINGKVELESFQFGCQDIKLTTPVTVEGSIKNVSGVLYLELMCSVSFDTNCSRCLEKISRTLDFAVNERLSRKSLDEEVIIIDSHEVDLDEPVAMGLCSALPINYVCSEDCKGLCHVCGCNLNHQSCDCEDDYIDPRLAALKDFLK